MWYVYILKLFGGNLYIGSTNDLKRRINEHKTGRSKYTKNKLPIQLEAYIAVRTELIARNLEKYLKTGSGKAVLKKRILSDEVLT